MFSASDLDPLILNLYVYIKDLSEALEQTLLADAFVCLESVSLL